MRFASWNGYDDEVEADIIGDSTDIVASAKHMVYDFIYSMEIGDIVIIEKTIQVLMRLV